MQKALVIGIDEYPASPLQGCVNDAERIASLLARTSSNFEVRKLQNFQATRSKIRKEIDWVFSATDFSLIYFAGHGIQTNVATYLATIDCEEGDEGIDFAWIQAAVGRLCNPQQTCVLLLDCCHSGNATVRSTGTRELEAKDIPSIGGLGRVLIAACKGDQLATEKSINGKNVGVFTHYLCEAIEGFAANDSGIVTITTAYDYITNKLGEQGEQTPVLRGDLEGRIVLAQGVAQQGMWRPKSGSIALSPKDAVARAENLLSQTLLKNSPQSHTQWQDSGYREACQAFEPVYNWFARRVDTQPELKHNTAFREKYESCQQFFKNLGSVSPGMKIPQGSVGLPLGAGTFGTVFRMNDQLDSGQKCFKVYHAHDLLDSQKVGRFKRGFAAMKQLDHPKIVKVREISEIPLGFFMDYIAGANAREYNPGSTQDPEMVMDLLLGVAETLQHAHGRGVIHRDVKPENILIKISPEGLPSAYLTDFDLSWFSSATQVTKLSEGFGSHFYAAPEQINSPNSAVAHRATVDTYSFGQLCFFFIAGRDPLAFNSEANARALEQELLRKWTDSAAATSLISLYKECTFLSSDKRIADFREICERIAEVSLTLKDRDAVYDTPSFLGEVRFTLSGEVENIHPTGSFTSFRSRSGRTEVAISTFKDAPKRIGIEVAFRPDSMIMEGRTSQDVRVKINSRVDAILQSYTKHYETRRSGAKSGAFEISVRIDHLNKERSGVVTAREIISKVLDQIEHT